MVEKKRHTDLTKCRFGPMQSFVNFRTEVRVVLGWSNNFRKITWAMCANHYVLVIAYTECEGNLGKIARSLKTSV